MKRQRIYEMISAFTLYYFHLSFYVKINLSNIFASFTGCLFIHEWVLCKKVEFYAQRSHI